ncbi:MAG: hypothetical protein FJ117_18270 [Deltaproteobacteria bacterium]|nr:hypothetical protein [Deltaproteobacteria bacterium]
MKKLIALVGAVVLVAAMASPSFAQDWAKAFKTTSLFQIWSVWENKYDFNNNFGASSTTTNDLTRRGISSRVNFTLDWGDAKFARGVVAFEMDSTNWGESSYTAAEFGSGTSGRYGVAGTDQVQLEIKHAFVQFTIPNTPLMLSAGAQWFGVGGRLVQSRDIPGIILTASFAPHSIRALWWRERETSRTTYEVNDTYGLTYDLAQKAFNVYAYGLYKNDLGTTDAPTKDNPYWIGVGGGFRPANLSLSGQLVYVGGKKDFPTGTDPDYAAYAAEVRADYTIGPGLSVGAEGFYSSGRDADKTDKITLYQRPAGSESHANFGLDRTVFFWMAFGEFGNQHNIQGDIGGFYYLLLNGKYSPTPWVRFSANYLYIGDTSSGTPGTGIDAATQVSGTKRPNSVGRTDADKSFVGHEINLITKFRIQPNFTYNIGIAYFIPGDVYDHPSRSAEAAFAVNTGMQLAF